VSCEPLQVFNPQTRRFEQQLRMHYQQVAFDVVGIRPAPNVLMWQVPAIPMFGSRTCPLQIFDTADL
jgi:hypothetical protein